MSLSQQDSSIFSEASKADRSLELLFAKADILYFQTDPGGMIVSVNSTTADWLDYEPEQLTGRSFVELFPEKEQEPARMMFKICLSKGLIKDWETRLTRQDRSMLPIVLNGMTLNAQAGTAAGVRFYARSRFDTQQARWQRDLALFTVKAVHSDFWSHLHENANRIAEILNVKNTGFSLERSDAQIQIAGWPAADGPDPDQWKAWIARDDIPFVKRTQAGSFWTHRVPDWIAISKNEYPTKTMFNGIQFLAVIPISNPYPGFMIVAHDEGLAWDENDIRYLESVVALWSESIPVRAVKDESEWVKERLAQARKIESLGLLAGGIVHEFKNLLAGIQGYASLVAEDLPNESPSTEDMRQIIRIAEKAIDQTSRLLAYTQGASYVVNRLDLNQLIKEVAGMLSRTIQKNVSIRAELDPKLEFIRGDASQIQHAILQLALNARDALSAGGRIIFKTQNIVLTEKDNRVHSGIQPGLYAQVSISDTGIGIPGDLKEKIFEPFFSTKGETGKGFGLAMVREIVERHGGFLSLFSEKDKGTVLKIHFPIQQPTPVRPVSRQEDKLLLGKETVLLVEDEDTLRDAARKILTRYGYSVMTAVNASEMVSLMKKHTGKIDLIMLDLTLPEPDMKKIDAWLTKTHPKIKILATGGMGERSTLGKSMDSAMVGYLQKPFQVRPLLVKVHALLHG